MSKQLRKKYSKEFKSEAVVLVIDQGYSKAEAGRSLGIKPDLVRRWQREFERVVAICVSKARQADTGSVAYPRFGE